MTLRGSVVRTRAARWLAITLCILTVMAVSDRASIMVGATTLHKRTLTGDAAKTHIDAQLAKHPQLRAERERVVGDFEAKGFRPTSDYMVEFIEADTSLLQKALMKVAPALGAQTLTGGSGEMDFSPWDAGNPGVFAAGTFMQNYNNGVAAYGTTMLDISTPGNIGVIMAQGTDTNGGTIGFRGAITSWAICTAGACSAAATACIWTGPGWGACTVAWCAGGAVGCAVVGVLNHVLQQYPQ
jgi:hypothetical protein